MSAATYLQYRRSSFAKVHRQPDCCTGRLLEKGVMRQLLLSSLYSSVMSGRVEQSIRSPRREWCLVVFTRLIYFATTLHQAAQLTAGGAVTSILSGRDTNFELIFASMYSRFFIVGFVTACTMVGESCVTSQVSK